MRRSFIWQAGLVFLGVFTYLYWARSNNFVVMNDEGIFLDGARRILQGQAPYRDFFILMGPGSFWLHAAAMKLFGITLTAARMVTLCDVSIIGACVFWLIARRHSLVFAAFTAAICVILETANPGITLPNHRWDSAAIALLAITLVTAEGEFWPFLAAGACAAFAAWATPSVLIVGVTVAVYLWRNQRVRLKAFLAGGAIVSLSAVVVLGLQGAIAPLIQDMLWTGSNYSHANLIFYGALLGGYAQLFHNAHGAELFINGIVALGIAVPSILPIVFLPLWWSQRRLEWGVLPAAALALLISTLPRPDSTHLLYIAPIFYVLVALGLARVQSKQVFMPLFMAVVFITMPFLIYVAVQRHKEVAYQSRVGLIRTSEANIALVRNLDEIIPAGSSLFVFPYLPVTYFMTLTENPTRYSYLQPGMMSEEDEITASEELQARPDARVLYFDFPESEILRIWPNTDPSKLKLRHMETYLADHYRITNEVPYQNGKLQLMERIPETAASR